MHGTLTAPICNTIKHTFKGWMLQLITFHPHIPLQSNIYSTVLNSVQYGRTWGWGSLALSLWEMFSLEELTSCENNTLSPYFNYYDSISKQTVNVLVRIATLIIFLCIMVMQWMTRRTSRKRSGFLCLLFYVCTFDCLWMSGERGIREIVWEIEWESVCVCERERERQKHQHWKRREKKWKQKREHNEEGERCGGRKKAERQTKAEKA